MQALLSSERLRLFFEFTESFDSLDMSSELFSEEVVVKRDERRFLGEALLVRRPVGDAVGSNPDLRGDRLLARVSIAGL